MIGELKTVAFDAPDIAALSTFYTSLAGWEQTYAGDDWVTLTSVDGWRIGLQLAPDHVPPQWPDPAHPQQAHLDIRVPDLAAATQRAVELGATLLRETERWNTLADPAGHPFDLAVHPEGPHPTIFGVMLDVPDAKASSAFYAELTGKPITYEAEGMAMLGNEGEQPILFQQVEGYAPRAGLILPTRSRSTSTSRSTTSRRPSPRCWPSVRPDFRARVRTGGSSPIRTASRSA